MFVLFYSFKKKKVSSVSNKMVRGAERFVSKMLENDEEYDLESGNPIEITIPMKETNRYLPAFFYYPHAKPYNPNRRKRIIVLLLLCMLAVFLFASVKMLS